MPVRTMLYSHNRRVAAFSLLPDRKPPWRCFGSAFGLECVAVLLLVWVPVLFPQRLEAVKRYWVTPITAPPVVAWKPQPIKPEPVKLKPVPVKRPVIKREIPKPEVVVVVPPKPKLIAPVFTSPVAHPVVARRNVPPAPVVARAFPDQHPISMGSSALPTLKRPREQVQTGGFGDPNGVPSNGQTNKAANIARLGSYDLPNGPGYGNGTGGAKGAKGTVASAGFGNGVAIGGPGGSGHSGGAVQQGVFADEHPVAGPKVRPAAATTARTEPVEILYKPKPVYTDEARHQKIEGEVLLQVAFSATGHLEVLRVTKGLGYGLDEAAVAAARQIRFRPARQDGQPVDSLATVHILFELAY